MLEVFFIGTPYGVQCEETVEGSEAAGSLEPQLEPATPGFAVAQGMRAPASVFFVAEVLPSQSPPRSTNRCVTSA
jgi:hypothetical protein